MVSVEIEPSRSMRSTHTLTHDDGFQQVYKVFLRASRAQLSLLQTWRNRCGLLKVCVLGELDFNQNYQEQKQFGQSRGIWLSKAVRNYLRDSSLHGRGYAFVRYSSRLFWTSSYLISEVGKTRHDANGTALAQSSPRVSLAGIYSTPNRTQ